MNPKALVAAVLVCLGTGLGMLSFAANPPGGTITPTGPQTPFTGTWTGTATPGIPPAANGESSCVEGANCDTFTLTVGGTQADWASAGKRIEIKITPPASADDYDLVIHKGANSNPAYASSGNGAGIPEVAHINPAADGVGVYTIHVIYFAVVPGDQYQGTATVVSLVPTPPPAATVDTTNHIGYENFEVPGLLTNVVANIPNNPGPGVTQVPTVEYMGRNAGEPSIGVNWNTDVTNFQSDLETLFVTFTNGCGDHGPLATWDNRVAPTSKAIDSDPIGFTDHAGAIQRVFAAELTATSPTCKISHTDTDGQPAGAGWSPETGPLGSGIDHETIGGGPYHSPLVGAAYPHAIYYCSQDLVAAFCLRSDDGGSTYNEPPIPTYTTECGGLHGHVKVGPDGTVYLPNKNCSGDEAAVVSEDNGVTWKIRHVQNPGVVSLPSESDPAVAIDDANRVYFAFANGDSAAAVAVSTDHGSTWSNIVDVSALSVSGANLKNIRYPAAVAGEGGRAAIAFLGTTEGGSANASSFNGIWHLYVAHTFDGGATWTTTDATPNMPVQRGCIWTGGGANICRNLLDFFDVQIDNEGRVQVGYVNGCPGGDCAQAAPSATGNGYAATATIARQSSGKRLKGAEIPGPTQPGMPFITQRRAGSLISLAWSEADTGGAAITAYQILRSTTAGAETLLATVPGTQTNFDDYSAADQTKTYYYKVVAVNSAGSSCPNNEIVAPPRGDTCNGLIIHQNDPTHPESTSANANPQLAIDYVAAGEPYQVGADNLMFKLKVTNLSTLPPNSRWRVVWDSFASPGQQYYVGMTTDGSSVPRFEYGTIATAVVGLVLGVPQETLVNSCTVSTGTSCTIPGTGVASQYNTDGTITIYVPRSTVGNPQKGDLLGAVNGRTFADNTTFERSTQLIDHTFVKAQTDSAFPPATYTVTGPNLTCAVATADSVKTHGAKGPFPIHLPLSGKPGIEPRLGGATTGNHTVVVTFAVPIVSVASATSSAGSATVTHTPNSNTVTVNLTAVPNAQTIGITLVGVNDGSHTSNVLIPMSVLLGDVNQDGFVLSGDYTATRAKSGSDVNGTTFKYDVNTDGFILSGDYTIVRSQSGKSIP